MMKNSRSVMAALLFCGSPWAAAEDLLQVYELALRNDPVLAAARSQRNAALESRPQALAPLLPNVQVTGRTDRVNRAVHDAGSNSFAGATRGNSDDSTFSQNQASIGLTQRVYNRGLWIQLDQTDNTIASANADYGVAQQDLIFRTSEAYFNVLLAKDTLTFAGANKEATARQLDQAKQRFEVGLIAITEVLEAQAAFDRARSEVIFAENQLDNAWEALHVIIKPDTVKALSRLQEQIALQMPEPQDMEQWSQAAQQQNLAIIAAVNDAQFAMKDIEVERSGHYPTLDLEASMTKDHSTGSTGSHVDTNRIGLVLNVPLYLGGGVSSRVRQARDDLNRAQERLDAQRREVNRDVRDSYRGVESSIGLVQALKATTVSARSALDATQAGYEVGTRTIIDVLDVQRRMFENERDYSEQRYKYILNGLSLRRAASILSIEDLRAIDAWLNDEDLTVVPAGSFY
jgi:outer membrane protein